MKKNKYKCEHCGTVEESEIALTVNHRGCRFKAISPKACKSKNGLMFIDTKQLIKDMKKKK